MGGRKKNNNNNNTPIPVEISLHWRYLHQSSQYTWKQIHSMNKYQRFSKASICRHMKKPIGENEMDRRHQNKGRPPLLSPRDKRLLLRKAEELRQKYGHFTARHLKLYAGLSGKVCDETIRKVLRQARLKYCHSRKKGVLKRKDLITRRKFASKVRRRLDSNIWTEGIAFYFDGVGFAHKYNPYDQAMSPKTMTWRRPHDGLSFERTAKGSHEGTGGRVAHLLCAIAHNKGMILAEQYEGRPNWNEFAKFVREQFPNLFERSNNPRRKDVPSRW